MAFGTGEAVPAPQDPSSDGVPTGSGRGGSKPQKVKRGAHREDVAEARRALKGGKVDREEQKQERKAEEAATGVKTPPDPLGFDQQKIEPSGDVREYSGHDRSPDTEEAAGQPTESEE